MNERNMKAVVSYKLYFDIGVIITRNIKRLIAKV